MNYEDPILVDLEDLEGVSGGGCNTGGSAGDNGCGGSDVDLDVKVPVPPVGG